MNALTSSMPARYLRLFWSYAGARILVIVGLTMVMSYAEGIGIVLFLPLFSSGDAHDPVSASVTRVFHALHVPFSPRGALPVIAAIFVAKGLLLYATSMYQQMLTSRTVRQLRERLLSALGRADYVSVVGDSAGVNANLVVNEVGRSAQGFLYYARSIPPAVNASVFFLIVLLLDWRLTLVCVAMGLTMVGLLRVSGRVAQRYSNVATQEAGRLTALVVQSLHAFKYLRATGSYPTFEGRLLEASHRNIDADFRAGAAGTLTISISQPLMVLFVTGVLFYRVAVQGAPAGSLFIVLMYFTRIMTEVFSLQTSWQSFCSHIGSVDVVRDAIERARSDEEHGGSLAVDGVRTALASHDVWFGYQHERFVLRNITLRIPARSTVAFVGASGSGKSTLVDLLTGTLKPTRGQVRLDDRDLAELDLAELRRHVGYVPQDAVVFDDTVANNLALFNPKVSEQRLIQAAEQGQCLAFIRAMPEGFGSRIGDRGVLLSGGQRQRLAIARELVKQPALLVLDEATSALDSESEDAIRRSIEQLRGQMTILIIAHRLSTVRNVDYLYVLHEGEVVEEGRYDELYARRDGRFRRMCELQQLGEDLEPGAEQAGTPS